MLPHMQLARVHQMLVSYLIACDILCNRCICGWCKMELGELGLVTVP